MVDETSKLAAATAAALVRAMPSAAWLAMRDRMAGLLGQGDPQRAQTVAEQLEQTRAELWSRAIPIAAIEARWQGRLESFLEAHADAAASVNAVLRELQAAVPPAPIPPMPGAVPPARPVVPVRPKSRISTAGWFAIIGIPLLLLLTCIGVGVIFLLPQLAPQLVGAPKYAVDDCVNVDRVGETARLAGELQITGKVSCDAPREHIDSPLPGPGVHLVKAVIDNPTEMAFNYCRPLVEFLIIDNDTNTVYCVTNPDWPQPLD